MAATDAFSGRLSEAEHRAHLRRVVRLDDEHIGTALAHLHRRLRHHERFLLDAEHDRYVHEPARPQPLPQAAI